MLLAQRTEETAAELGERKNAKEKNKKKKSQEPAIAPNGNVAEMLPGAAVVAAVEGVEALVVDAALGVAGRGEHVAAVIDTLDILGAEAETAADEIVGLVDAETERLPDIGYVLSDKHEVVTVMAGHRNILGERAKSLPVLRSEILVALVEHDDGLAALAAAGHDIGQQHEQALDIGIGDGAVALQAAEHAGAGSLVVVERHGETMQVAVDVGSGHRMAGSAQLARNHERGEARYVAEHVAAPQKLGQNIVRYSAEALAPAGQTSVGDYHLTAPAHERARGCAGGGRRSMLENLAEKLDYQYAGEDKHDLVETHRRASPNDAGRKARKKLAERGNLHASHLHGRLERGERRGRRQAEAPAYQALAEAEKAGDELGQETENAHEKPGAKEAGKPARERAENQTERKNQGARSLMDGRNIEIRHKQTLHVRKGNRPS